MNPEDLIELLFVAANAKTEEEKARVAWRAGDYMWLNHPRYGVWFCRRFNDLCQDKEWPFVKDLWSEEEKNKHREKYTVSI